MTRQARLCRQNMGNVNYQIKCTDKILADPAALDTEKGGFLRPQTQTGGAMPRTATICMAFRVFFFRLLQRGCPEDENLKAKRSVRLGGSLADLL